YETARAWFPQAVETGWATCPITENGVVRILSNPSYPNLRLSVPDAAELLRQFVRVYKATHHFWADEISLLDEQLFDLRKLSGHKQLTDLYLLGLCHTKGGRLVTLDQGVQSLLPCLREASNGLIHRLNASSLG
ncbi:MAG: hypothetical protein NZL85_10590, partial [Fimbriimonadales bacterium]|nr:hypothetical protein [Fimbriimonadales bacterium]